MIRPPQYLYEWFHRCFRGSWSVVIEIILFVITGALLLLALLFSQPLHLTKKLLIMKKLLTILLAVAFAATSASAQMATKSKTKMKGKGTHCYMMTGDKLMKCMGMSAKPMAVTETVTLKNGTTISPEGAVTMKDGTTQTLSDGQCISLAGKIGDCGKMHAMAKGGKMKMKSKGDKDKEKMKEDTQM